jgi:Rps23 Pro-64 3,4-dihydroxylase Tpa1-like proline 4-hydroxylase
VIRTLIDDTLLRSVRSEIVAQINFTPKETDIYKIHQSGDLANLDGLDDASLSKLPSLLQLRDSLYSKEFREWISHVGNSGPLSGNKTDMAINVYTPGCHLLCHDDVIGSRRLSYILYLTDPDKPWQPEWGGALRLYPTTTIKSEDGKTESEVPSPEFSVVIPPSWNQLSFFTIQPGHSFHDVEEVYHRKEGQPGEEVDGGRIRMAISGWFHIPQEGEEGYQEGLEEKLAERSSLNQLQQKDADQFDLPQPRWIEIPEVENPEEEDEWIAEELQFLVKYINPGYLVPDTLEELAENFQENSVVTLTDFLHPKFLAEVEEYIRKKDGTPDPEFLTGNVGKDSLIGIARPPHKHRFAYCHLPTEKAAEGAPLSPLHQLMQELFASNLFVRWLRLLTNLDFHRSSILQRRFRKGQDYTLATGYDANEPQLEISLGLTPTTGWGGGDDDDEDDSEDGIPAEAPEPKEDEPQVGGYEVYMAADDENDDEEDELQQGPSGTGAGNRRKKADPAIYKSTAEDEDDGVLFSMPASWNTLSVVLRDSGLLKFVKYVSESAPGDRWDVSALFSVKVDDDDDDDEDDE